MGKTPNLVKDADTLPANRELVARMDNGLTELPGRQVLGFR